MMTMPLKASNFQPISYLNENYYKKRDKYERQIFLVNTTVSFVFFELF